MDELSFAADFPAARREDWLALVEKALQGAPFEQLRSRTYDDIPIEPLYARAAHATPIAGRAAGAPWRILQRVDHPDPAAANAEALHDLENGATGLALVFAGSLGAYGFGLDAAEGAIARTLEGVQLDAGISLELDLGAATRDAAPRLAALVKRRGLDAGAVDLRFGFDPLGAMASGGAFHLHWRDAQPMFVRTLREFAEQGFRGPYAAADGRVIHNAGGSEAQELAFALGAAVTYLRALEAGGVALDAARRMLFFRLAADADQFLTTAKFRALRKLWARVEEVSDLAHQPIFVSAETAWRMLTRRDPHVNLLRATVAVAAAGFGGADAISVLPFTAALGLPDRFARRLARNTQLVLIEESNLAKVTDPAAGSGAIEDLTDKLCAAAWLEFQAIERAGGIDEALKRNLIQNKVAAVRAAREKAIAERRDLITGTTAFPDPDTVPAAVLRAEPVRTATKPPVIQFDPLPAMRLAEPHE